MRRKDREVTDFTEIAGILSRADTFRLGINGSPYPYVVPLSFGMDASGGKIVLFFHGAAEGFKHDLLARDPNVCVEADAMRGYAAAEGGYTAAYESFIGFGKARAVTGAEALRGLDLLMERCGFAGAPYDRSAPDYTRVYRIDLISFTGKRRVI